MHRRDMMQIAQLKASLVEQLTCLRQLDKEICRDLVDVDGITNMCVIKRRTRHNQYKVWMK